MTLDRSLTFYNHLRKTAAKVRSCSSLLSKLTGSRGANAQALHTAAVALAVYFSVAEWGKEEGIVEEGGKEERGRKWKGKRGIDHNEKFLLQALF